MYVVYINLLYFLSIFCLLTIKIFFPQKNVIDNNLPESQFFNTFFINLKTFVFELHL